MPVQSSIIVTRPLSDQELRIKAVPAIKWHLIGGSFCINFVFYPISAFYLECAADYFLHEKGGPLHSTNDQVQFYQMFAACKNVEVDYEWSGLACLDRLRLPFAGPIPEIEGAFAGFAYHGDGIAMNTYSASSLSDLAIGQTPQGLFLQ